MKLYCGHRTVDLSRPQIMGVLNITPDSFSDGGQLYGSDRKLDLDKALRVADQMVRQGAAFIDVGGESTRPGAKPVSQSEECERVLPVVESIAQRLDVVVSVDTSSPEVMTESARLGAGLINDVRALQRDGALAAAVRSGLPICLMHMQGMPSTMQENPKYGSVVEEVGHFLKQRVEAVKAEAQVSAVAVPQLLLDPGFGFGKTDEHNLALMRELSLLCEAGFPLLVGLSRKSIIGRLLGREVHERLPASLAFAMLAVQRGAQVVRVHDVAETKDTLSILEHVAGEGHLNGA